MTTEDFDCHRSEGLEFLRYEVRNAVTVAVFWCETEVSQWDAGVWTSTQELALDRASLEFRQQNLRAQGCISDVTSAALAGWPAATEGTWAGSAVPLARATPAQACPPTSQDHANEQRGATRSRLHLPGSLVSEGITQPCIILDVSDTGAQVGLPGGVEAPQLALLRLADGTTRAAQLRWQHGTAAGFAFLAPVDA
jgi:hypothetical protein